MGLGYFDAKLPLPVSTSQLQDDPEAIIWVTERAKSGEEVGRCFPDAKRIFLKSSGQLRALSDLNFPEMLFRSITVKIEESYSNDIDRDCTSAIIVDCDKEAIYVIG